jgi:F0F1-type ATP synthase assembly protein I
VANSSGRPKSQQQHQARFLRKAGLYIGVAFELPGTIMAGLVIGYYADQHFHTSPWLLLTFTALAFVGAFVRLLQWVKVFARERDGRNGTQNHYSD